MAYYFISQSSELTMDNAASKFNSQPLNELFRSVRNLNLNFSVKETPFSLHISIRKTVIKYYDENLPLQLENLPLSEAAAEKIRQLELENGSLIAQIVKLEKETSDLKKSDPLSGLSFLSFIIFLQVLLY